MPASGSQLEFSFPAVVTPRGDGCFNVKPGCLVAKIPEISADAAAIILGRSSFIFYRYLKEGLLTAKQAKSKARSRLDRSEVEPPAIKGTVELMAVACNFGADAEIKCPMKHWITLTMGAILVFATWSTTPWAVATLQRYVSWTNTIGQVGDIFGLTNSLFSGLAMLGVVYALLLQISQSTQMRYSLLLGALPQLIAHERAFLRAISPNAFSEQSVAGMVPVVIKETLKRTAHQSPWNLVKDSDSEYAARESLTRLLGYLVEMQEIHKKLQK